VFSVDVGIPSRFGVSLIDVVKFSENDDVFTFPGVNCVSFAFTPRLSTVLPWYDKIFCPAGASASALRALSVPDPFTAVTS
jgi:hypothetical protein